MTASRPDEVLLASHDPTWSSLFEAERERLLGVAGDTISDVQHIGSTSIPGIAAKPIIDVLIVLRRALSDAEIAAIAEPGYEYRGEQNISGRQYFSRRSAPAFHLHAFVAGHPDIQEMLLFRDYLRAHADVARAYEALKRALQARHPNDRIAYTDGKTDFVRSTNATALARREAS